ncbi:hypothetical protein ACHAXT_004673 [Thalassiosira profunda]
MWAAINRIVLLSPLAAAFDQAHSPSFAFTGRYVGSHRGISRCRSQCELQAKKKNPLLELVANVALGRKGNDDEIESVQDFDADLASEIQDALDLAGILDDDMNIEDAAETVAKIDDPMVDDAIETDEDTASAESVQDAPKQIPRPPAQSSPQQNSPTSPPHTALAQVIANQYNIDLASVPASGSKITADDVEYYAWKLSQPPCTTEALELAYSLGFDLTELYEGEELQLSDVELYQELYGSLRMTSVINREAKRPGKKSAKTSALDDHLERGIDKLSEKARGLAGAVTGSFVQQVKSQTQKLQSSASETLVGVFADGNGREKPDDITSVGDFDASLALEIQEALSFADLDDDVADVSSASTASPGRPPREELESMTCDQLKEQLRLYGMKVSGRKSELVDRLCSLEVDANDVNDDGVCIDSDDSEDDRPPTLFFASRQ